MTSTINLIQENDNWISVDERLPDMDSEVLTYRDSFKNGELYTHCVYTKTGFIDYKTGLLIKQPSHWQPLPSPPKP